MLGAVSLLVLGYFIVMELQMVALGVLSAVALRRDRLRLRRHGADDMLSSDLSPPVSIIVPAHNEAAGIVESVRSMTMLRYPRFEIVVVNDGSTDETLDRLREGFRLIEVTAPFRRELETAAIRAVYRSTLPLPIVVVDKDNGGKTDALNAGVNVARYPYVLLTDADVVMDGDCLLRAMRHVVEDRVRTVAVGGNIRPINGCRVNRGRVVETHLPAGALERAQMLEYIRSFVAARPGWSLLNSLVLVSGAFGIYRRDVLAEVGGFRSGHLGEDLDLTMRLHKHMLERRRPYRIVYAPDAVVWTEVPSSRTVLRRQRVRWHRGLAMVVRDFRGLILNPRYGKLGMVGWPCFVFFEFLAPVVEAAGWLVLPAAAALGLLDVQAAVLLLVFAYLLGAVNSLVALFLDEAFGYFTNPLDALRLLGLVLAENLGLRQQTVWWRIRAILAHRQPPQWGAMERRGVGNLAATGPGGDTGNG
jgi:cellulose synthase/poly-beta-1,6-N-acetylglucosamine synthase-like glycosyltransferase